MLLDLHWSQFVFLSNSNVLWAGIICISSSSLGKNHNELFSGYNQIPNNICLLQILRLQECLSKYEQSDDGSTPQVILTQTILIWFYVQNSAEQEVIWMSALPYLDIWASIINLHDCDKDKYINRPCLLNYVGLVWHIFPRLGHTSGLPKIQRPPWNDICL